MRKPVRYASLSWENASASSRRIEARLGGFASVEEREGYRGAGVPGVHVLRPGRQPAFQNAAFTERRQPMSVNASVKVETRSHLLVDHALKLGGELSRGRWRDERTRNGGVTWRPYSEEVASFDPTDASTWQAVGSEWGGNIRLDSDIASEALFAEDAMTIGSRLTLTTGLRFGSWSGFIRPRCDPTAGCRRFQAVRANGFDPRLGAAWDVTGRGTFAIKAHVGRYHQGMHALFFDRVIGANVYENQRFYNTAPPFSASDTVFTEAQRDAPGSGFNEFYDETILDVSGRVEGYRQPYVDQGLIAIEKGFGERWKLEALYTHRRNGDIVGLVDRNLADNYTPIRNVHPDHRFQRGLVIGPDGDRLVIPQIYASNADILEILERYRGNANELWGYPITELRALTWNPDVVLTAVSGARRVYDQATVSLRTVQPAWRAEGSVTGARLRGNVPGVAGFGTTATRFSAGPFVNPNEGINGEGYLPDALQMEGKVWAVARLPRNLEGGLVYTHILGERFTPSFEVLGRYSYTDDAGV
ncbi:MAG TPA: TonB-dependent receptor, partial [Gemmatimonadaceae bacterium]|nr:TonB-dependent receptor [Gemmatimonadaceae bacterium]